MVSTLYIEATLPSKNFADEDGFKERHNVEKSHFFIGVYKRYNTVGEEEETRGAN